MQPTLWEQFYNVAALPLLCLCGSCCLGLWYWQRLPRSLRILVGYLVFNLLIEVGSRFAAVAFRQNLPLLHLYTLGEFVLFSMFYAQILGNTSMLKKYFRWIVGAVLVLVVLNTLLLQGIFEFNSYAKTLVQVVIILYALDFAFRLPERSDPDPALTQMLRLINAAILIYYCGSLFIFMTSQFESQTRESFRVLWNINRMLNLIFQLIVFVALWKVVFRRPKSSSSPARAS